MRTAFMLAQGGEFAFVLLSLAAELKVLPEELNKLLIIVVVISMALTPGLASVGRYLADRAVEDESESGTTAHFWKTSKRPFRCSLHAGIHTVTHLLTHLFSQLSIPRCSICQVD